MDNFTKLFSKHPFILFIDNAQFHFEKVVISLGMILASFILCWSIASNSIFNISLPWASELSRYIIVWVIFIGTSTLIRFAEHVNIDFVLNVVSEKISAYINVLIYLSATIFLIYLCYLGYVMTDKAFASGQTGSDIHIKMGWVYLSFPIGMLLSAISSFKILIIKLYALKNLKGG